MRIYAAADLHARPERLRRVSEAVAVLRPDLLVLAGDICQYRRPAAVLTRLSALGVPILAVRGNSDPRRIVSLLDADPCITFLHLRTVERGGVSFTGVGGTALLPLSSRIAWRAHAAARQLARRITPETVLVTHPPPRGILDGVLGRVHAGCRVLRRLIETHPPRLVLCGHIHEQPGVVELARTTVVNCTLGRGGGALVELHSGERPRVEML